MVRTDVLDTLVTSRSFTFRSSTNVVDPAFKHSKCDVIDAALNHLIESEENLDDGRDRYPPQTVKDCCNTSVLGLKYRMSIEQKWR